MANSDPAEAKPLRILMLDDPTHAALIDRALQRGGFEVDARIATDRGTFLGALEQEVSDVVTVDYKLPDYDAVSAVKAVRQKSPDIPVILMTGALSETAPFDIIKAGADDYVSKYDLMRMPFAVRRTLRDAAERRARHRAERALRTLSAGNQALARATDEAGLLQTICRIAVDEGGYELAWVGIAENDDGKTVRPVADSGGHSDYIAAMRMSWADTQRGQGPTGTAIRTGEVCVNQDFAHNPRTLPWRALALEHGFQSSIALPLRIPDGPLGSFTIYSREADAFDAAEGRLLAELAQDISAGIVALRAALERDESRERLQKSMEATVQAVAKIVEIRDPYTAGHQRRVAQLAVAIARHLRLPEDRIHGLSLAAAIHDIGKIEVPAEILNKPGALSSIERQLIQLHAQTGHDVLADVDLAWPIADIILQHHERIDGSGYPKGLRGAELLLEAKIIAVADVVESMASHRPYRPALGISKALEELRRGRGLQYEAEVVDACIRVVETGAVRLG